eukprot:250238_1
MATNWNGGGVESIQKRIGFGASNPISNKSIKRLSRRNDKQNIKLGNKSMKGKIEIMKNGKEEIEIVSATDGGFSQKRNARYCVAPTMNSKGEVIAMATAAKGADGVSKDIDSGALERIAVDRNDTYLAEQGVFQTIMVTDGDSSAAQRAEKYGEKYNKETYSARSKNHAVTNWKKKIDSNKGGEDNGRGFYDLMKEEQGRNWTHDKQKAMVNHLGIDTSMKLSELCRDYGHLDPTALAPLENMIMTKFNKVPHHVCSADKKHSKCKDVGINIDPSTHWCPVVRGDINYKSNKNHIAGVKQPLPVSKKGNTRLLKAWNDYWKWVLVMAVIVGSKTNGTNPIEAFNHSRDGFTVKRISTKDPIHYHAQSFCAVLMCNEGYETVTEKVIDSGMTTRKDNVKAVDQLSKNKKYNKAYSEKAETKRNRKLRTKKIAKDNVDTPKNYKKNGFGVKAKTGKKKKKKKINEKK